MTWEMIWKDYADNPGKATGKITVVYPEICLVPSSLKNLHHDSEKTALSGKYGAKGIIIMCSKWWNTVNWHSIYLSKLIPDPAVYIGKEDGMAKGRDEDNAICTIDMTNRSGLIKAQKCNSYY